MGGPHVFCACVPQGVSKETSGILKNKQKETELRFPGAVVVGASLLWGVGRMRVASESSSPSRWGRVSARGDVAPGSLNSRIPAKCQLHAGNSWIPQLGYVLGGRETSPGSDCDSALHVQELPGWWLPGADGCPIFRPQTSPVCCTVSCYGLVHRAAAGLSSSGALPTLAPLPVSSLPLTFHECSLVPPRSPGCASPVGHLILRSRSPQPSGLPGDVADGTLV